MKKPYIKSFEVIANFSVWIVDGNYIRKNIDEEFTNFGQHYRFKFIPKNEFWIDKECASGEEKYYIESMLVMNRLMAQGISKKEAARVADRIERRERAKSELMKKEKGVKNNAQKLLKDIRQKFLKTYSGKIKVWVVNGELIRDLFFLDFTEGGHDKVYSFIPRREIWLDNDISPRERKFVFLHELHERNLMEKGIDYEAAHKDSSEVEHISRINPKNIQKKIREEMKISNSSNPA